MARFADAVSATPAARGGMTLGEATVTTRLPSAPPILPGLAYIRPLGSGGFADVFLYEQDMPRRNVAVKVMPSDVRDPELRRMFNAEADVLAHLSAHPSIVTVYQAGISADGRPYIVMEYCPGSLAQRYRIERIPVDEVLADRRPDGGRARVRAPRRARAPRRQAEQHPHHDLRHARARRLRHLVVAAARDRRRGARDVDPVERARGRRRADRRDDRQRGVEPRRDRVLAPRRPQPVRATRARPEHQGAAAPSHRAGDLHRRSPRADVPASLQAVLATAMSRDPARRQASAREFAEALRAVQAELGLSPTPLEIPDDEWSAASGPVDFGDTALRGPRALAPRARRAPQDPRPTAGVAALARDEDTEFSSPDAAPRAGAARGSSAASSAVVVAVAAVVVDALRDGGALMRRRTIAGPRRGGRRRRGRGRRERRLAGARRAGDARRRHRRCGRCRPAKGAAMRA